MTNIIDCEIRKEPSELSSFRTLNFATVYFSLGLSDSFIRRYVLYPLSLMPMPIYIASFFYQPSSLSLPLCLPISSITCF